MQFGLDLGGIDVGAAGDDHVLGPVAQVEEAVLVEIANVAGRDQAGLLRRRALGVVAVIGEVGDAARAGDDLADLAIGQGLAVRIDHLDPGLGDGMADRAGMGQPLFGVAIGDHADLGRAVVFVDHRPPPLDHRPLDRRGAGGGRVNDELQRRQVVLGLHLLRQLEQPVEHDRHHVHVRDLLTLDDLQQFFRVEARLQDHLAADARGQKAIAIGGGVVHRPGHHGGDRLARRQIVREAEAADQDVSRNLRLFRRWRAATHALGISGGSRGVDDRAGPSLRRRRARLEALQPGVPVGHAVRHGAGLGRHAIGRRDLGRRRHHQHRNALGQHRADRLDQVGVDDDGPRAGVLEQILRLGRGIVPVHRRRIGADQAGGRAGFEERQVVAQVEGDQVALADAQ